MSTSRGGRGTEEEGEADSLLSGELMQDLIPGPWDDEPRQRQTLNQLSYPGAPAFFKRKIYLFIWERASKHGSMWGGEGQRGRGRKRISSWLPTECRAQHRAGSQDPEIMSGNQELDTQPTEPPRCPHCFFYFNMHFYLFFKIFIYFLKTLFIWQR